MASPQWENGFTKIANEIIDELVKTCLLGSELQVCLFIIRKTYGYGKIEDGISLTQFEHGTNKSRPTIVKAIKNLQLVNMVELVKCGDSKNSFNIYRFNKNYESWKQVNTCQLVKRNNLTSKGKAQKLVRTCLHTKENTKENTKEIYSSDFLEFYNAYPKKSEKPHAFKCWKKLNGKRPPLEVILGAIKKQIEWRDNSNGEFRPEWKNPATWLNKGCWEDETRSNEKSDKGDRISREMERAL
jgi:phage replication O-like protein O